METDAETTAMHRTYEYRLYPTKKQAKVLRAFFNFTRDLYNAALQERIECYRKTGKTITLYDQNKSLTEIRQDKDCACAWMSVTMQRGALARVNKALKGFFRRVKAGQTPGFPRFKGWRRWKSIEITESYRLKEGRLFVKGVRGGMRTNMARHNIMPEDATLCDCTIKHTPKGYRLFVRACIGDAPTPMPKGEVKHAVGCDVGIKSFVMTDKGESFDSPNWYREAEKTLARKQQALSAAKRGTCRWRRALRAVQKWHSKVSHQRKDFHHKLAREFVKRFDLLVFEDLRIANMARNHRLAKSIHDKGWAAFIGKVAYKAEEAGKHFVQVDPRGTSQKCSGCGAVVEKSLDERTHHCHVCGLTIDRDENAARNILRLGVSHFSQEKEALDVLQTGRLAGATL